MTWHLYLFLFLNFYFYFLKTYKIKKRAIYISATGFLWLYTASRQRESIMCAQAMAQRWLPHRWRTNDRRPTTPPLYIYDDDVRPNTIHPIDWIGCNRKCLTRNRGCKTYTNLSKSTMWWSSAGLRVGLYGIMRHSSCPLRTIQFSLFFIYFPPSLFLDFVLGRRYSSSCNSTPSSSSSTIYKRHQG